MKNFNASYMQENGTAKKTLSRKEYDEQLALRFAAAEEKRHEEASAKAKAEFAAKSEEEQQKTMNEFADVENKPITKRLAEGYARHEDITFFAVATTGLNTEDKTKAVKKADGQLDRILIPKDEPTLFKAETYTYNEAKGAYTVSDSISIFIEATDTVVQRAIQAAQDGGYDVFANADFVLEDYLAGNDVLPKDDARAQIANYLNKQSGMIVCYGAFHESILKSNAFPTAEGSLDLNRAMVEQAKFGRASLVSCFNQILKKEKDDKLELASTTEKLIADAVCLNYLMSDFGKTVPFLANEESLSKFSDKDRQVLGDADESVRIVAEERRRARSRAEMAEARRRLRDREHEASQPDTPLSRREMIGRRREMADRMPESPAEAQVSPVPAAKQPLSVAEQFKEYAEGKGRAPYSLKEFVQGVTLGSGMNVQCTVPGKEEINPDKRTVIISSNPSSEKETSNCILLAVTEENPFEKMFMTARRMRPESIIIVDDGFAPVLAEIEKEEQVPHKEQAPKEQEQRVSKEQEQQVPKGQEQQVPKEQEPAPEATLTEAVKDIVDEQAAAIQVQAEVPASPAPAPAPSSFDALVKAINAQNELLAKQNEISAHQAKIEENKIAEMQKQTILMERQAETMEKLTILMDNLTKVYSEKDVENLRVEVDEEREEILQDFGKAAEGIRSPKAEEIEVEPQDPFEMDAAMEDTRKPLEKRIEDTEGRP